MLYSEQLHISRKKTLLNLEQLLVQFESKFLRNGGKMQWAETAEDACLEIAKIVNQSGGNFQYDDKSRIISEIGFEPYLHKTGLNRLVSAMNNDGDANSLIVNGAFMVSESGFVLANVVDAQIANRALVVVVGIEQIVSSLVDLAQILEMVDGTLPSSALLTGTEIENCNLVVVDNGRSDVLNLSIQSDLLAGVNYYLDRELHENGTGVYPGVDGIILGKYLKANKEHFLPDKFFINGYYGKDVGAMPITDILLAELNAWAVKNGTESDLTWRSWKNAVLSRKFMNKTKIGPFSLMRTFLKRGWNKKREFPKTSKSFNEQWVKQRPNVRKTTKLTDIPKGQLLVRKPATDGLDRDFD